MNDKELISALEALLEEAKLAERKIEYSSQVQRLEKRVKELEETMVQLKKIVEVLYRQVIVKNNR